ncbi:reverse transcriptase-like protein [Novosphingobium sp. BW1]|nr:reverse transcriptase-like protein [Novosphingobium sp. BW1]
MAGSRTKIYFDGGCRPNPGRMEAAVVVRGEAHLFDGMGEGGSFDAEWMALLEALELACRIGLEDVVLLGDALAVVNEAQAVLVGGSGREPYATRLRELVAKGPSLRVRWVRRGQNLAGIALDRRHLR